MEKLDKILDSYCAKGGKTTKNELLGAAFVVVNKDGVIYQGSAGHISSSPDSPGFTPDSFTIVASLTKLITATCAMQLVEKGLIGLDDDVRPLVPQLAEMKILRGFVGADVPYLEENTTPITLRQLLTHTVGLGYASGDPDLSRWAKHIGREESDLQDTLEIFNTPLKFTPGQGWYYGTALDWAGQVIEKITGKTLGEYMTEHLFKPLGMNDTGFRRDALPQVQDRTVPNSYRNEDKGELSSGDEPFSGPANPKVHSGGAGLYTTAADYARILQALLQSFAGGDSSLLKKETVEEMFRPQLTDVQRRWLKFLTDMFHDGFAPDFKNGMPLDHGISGVINLEDEPGKRRKGSMMWAGMYNGHWFIDPESGIGATLITNISPHPDLLTNKVWDELERGVYSDLLPSVGR
ncbi:Acyltransferase LovD [Cytospora mali]|uniref:Acyltransferase LovD n=1 Tax=Cytospora mali TaxID=578113 RepID=A0A194V3A8_CYTMA|nr:Acyltransferase LovD [Valsa mali var. pyri (nom. inval.)]